jgi:hypothetical protein
MTSERIKEIQEQTAYSESVSVMLALKQVWNECEQEQLAIQRVSKALPSNDLANWTLRNGWTYNFCDGKWWQLQESQNYIKKTTKEIANMIEGNVC